MGRSVGLGVVERWWGHVSLALALALSLGSAGCVTSHRGDDDDAGMVAPADDEGLVTAPVVAADAGHDSRSVTEDGSTFAIERDSSTSVAVDAAQQFVDATVTVDAGVHVADAALADSGEVDAAIGPEPIDAAVDVDEGIDASAADAGSEPPPVMSCPVGEIEHTDGSCRSMNHDRLDSGFARCRIRDDDTLWCWGAYIAAWTTWQQTRHPTRVGEDADWATISVGAVEGCGLKRSGQIYCFGEAYDGDGPYGTTIDNDPHPLDAATDWAQVSAGAGFACALKDDGSLWCWGLTQYLTGSASTAVPVQVGSDTDWAQVAAGTSVACALKHDGSLWCWGYNDSGHVGDGTKLDRAEPVPIAGGPYAQVELGGKSCAIRVDGTLWCWGRPDYIGPEYLVPTRWDASVDWRQITSNGYTMCGLRAGGELACLDQASQWVPAPVDEGQRYVNTATWLAEHEDGSLRAWGSPGRGDGSGVVEPLPVLHASAHDWSSMAMRHQRITSLHGGDTIWTYGSVHGTSPWLTVATSGQAECAIRGDHTLWCWGAQFFGTPDDTYWSGNYEALQMGTAADWIDVAMAANGFACGIRAGNGQSQGRLWCVYPQYNASRSQGWSPADGANDWTSVTASSDMACGTRADGSAWCWKMGWYSSLSFSRPNLDHDWEEVEAGWGGGCGLKHGGELWCWGTNFYGQLGNGTRSTTPSTTPTQVIPGSHWLEVSPAQSWTCGIQQDHSLWCWGQNMYGQLGVGFPGSARLAPVRVGTDNDWEHVSTMSGADQLTCALRHGERWCWGQNQIGFVTGISTYSTNPSLVQELPEGSAERFCARSQDLDTDGYAGCMHDCNDSDFDVNPDMPELCNAKDDDCDGAVDEGCP